MLGGVSRAPFLSAVTILPLIVGAYLLSRTNYLLFHALIEIFAVVVAVAIFSVGWNTRRYSPISLLLGLAAFYPGVAIVDSLHFLAYSGMGVFPDYGSNLPTQLWIAGRFLEAGAFGLAVLFIGKPLPWRTDRLLGVSTVLAGSLLLLIFTGLFPDCYREGTGLTSFKIASEYIISALFAAALVLLWRGRSYLERKVWFWLLLSLVLKILAEMSFTLYMDVYGFFNFLGHLFKLISAGAIYLALVQGCLTTPYRTIFHDLARSRESLKDITGTLEQRVQQRTEELNLRTLELEQSNKELEAFTYSVSHDLRQPLRAMDGFSLALLEDYGDRLDETGQDFLGRIRSAAQRMSRLIDDLLRLSRLGRTDMVIETLDLSAMVQEIASELQEKDPSRSVEVRIAPNQTADGDRQLISILLENLLENAWKFTSGRQEAVIEFGSCVRENDSFFYVRDNGAGFEMRHADRIFEPFFRLHTEKEFPGTGIGMAIAHRIVRRHGGEIEAEGIKGQGAGFFFSLHSEEENAQSETRPSLQMEDDRGAGTIFGK